MTTLITAMLDDSGGAALAAGNIGLPLLDAADSDARVLVAEVSSFQLAFTTEAFRPRVAVLLNVAPDHLDWHGSFEEYAAAKAQVFAHQRADDLLVYNGDDDVASRLADDRTGATRRVLAGVAARVPDRGRLARRPGGGAVRGRRRRAASTALHDRANALAAAAAAFDVGATRRAASNARCATTRGSTTASRAVGNTGGVQYYDDSKATNPHATLSAVAAFDETTGVVLIAGGRNKGLDLSVLRPLAPTAARASSPSAKPPPRWRARSLARCRSRGRIDARGSRRRGTARPAG